MRVWSLFVSAVCAFAPLKEVPAMCGMHAPFIRQNSRGPSANLSKNATTPFTLVTANALTRPKSREVRPAQARRA